MASFDPPEPPFEPGEPTPPPILNVPLPPPEVGFGSPFVPADAENRDRILDWWRMWWRRVFFPWVAAFSTYWADQWDRLAEYVNTWIAAADEYITEHAIAGYSWRTTATVINPTVGQTTPVTFTGVDQEHRPLVIGDLVSDQTFTKTFGIITALIDATHATVTTIGQLSGFNGHGWWVTATAIAHGGTTPVVLVVEVGRPPQVGDFVMDQTASVAYGIVTIVTDNTHVTVNYIGILQGPQGIQGIQGIQGDPGVVQSIVAGPFITVDDTDPANPIVSGTSGGAGVDTIVAGTNITVDDTDPDNPIVSATGGGSGTVDSVVAGDNVTVDDTDPANPIVSAGSPGSALVESVVAGDNVTVDDTDPANPIVSAGSPGSALVESVVAGDNVTVDDTDPANPIVSAGSPGSALVESVVAGDNVTVDDTDPANPIVNATNGGGVVETIVAGANVTVDDTDPANPIVAATGGGGGGIVESVVAGTNVTIDDSDPANPIVNASVGGAGEVVAMGNYPSAPYIALDESGSEPNIGIQNNAPTGNGTLVVENFYSTGVGGDPGLRGFLIDYRTQLVGPFILQPMPSGVASADAAVRGSLYFDSGSNRLLCHDGTTWHIIDWT